MKLRNLLGIAASLSVLAVSGAILAFPAGQYWHMPSAGDVPNPNEYDPNAVGGNNRAGAGGIYGTGSSKDYGIKCSHCHVQEGNPNAGMVDATITPNPAWQDVNGEPAYEPGMQYTITVQLTGEHLGNSTGAPGNTNGFALAVEDANGDVAGVYITDSGERSDQCAPAYPDPDPATFTTVVWGDCHGVVFTGGQNRDTWTFDWVAPAAGAGDVTIFYSVVDGNTAGDSSLDDDVKEGTIPLQEGT